MRVVNRFEANLLTVVYGTFGRRPESRLQAIAVQHARRPRCLSRDCVALVEQALRLGCIEYLARGGGWKTESFVRPDGVARGPLWKRTTPEQLAMSFSPVTLDFLCWVVETDLSGKKAAFSPQQAPTLADHFLMFLTVGRLIDTKLVAPRLLRQALFYNNPLIALMFTDRLARHGKSPNLKFERWMSPLGSAIFESLQGRFSKAWLDMEHSKRQINVPEEMRTLGQMQRHVIHQLLEFLEQAGRFDLARFLLETLHELLQTNTQLDAWSRSLHLRDLRIAERSELYADTLVFLEQAEHLQRWYDTCLGVAFFDENYAASQLWKSHWERWDVASLMSRAAKIRKQSVSF